ncbi:hypothetical protein [Nocardia bovistercoris]|uniref:Uncharacterized protein n=1 Tax=Nocardia bovistercoris TaxID=2785916 RepID=A0A931I7W1_9NOCA|nr:hypothetical protein [Nocardia bovistercoris]MBH0775023.1 hypothetical protein [Nocardia bovistercoris]
MTDYSATWRSPAPKFNRNPKVQGVPEDVDPKVFRWLESSVRHGAEAGIDPRLVMAIVLNEGADSNLTWDGKQGELKDWLREKTSPLREGKDGYSNSLGLTNMKKETFNRIKDEYPHVFAGREWSDLADDQDLAIQAAAYNLAWIKRKWTDKIPSDMKSRYSLNEVLAAGYNAEGFFGDYVKQGELGHKATMYSKMSRNSFYRAQGLMEKAYSWEDVVDPGMRPWPVDPGLDIVDIPPFGGYPEKKEPGFITGPGRTLDLFGAGVAGASFLSRIIGENARASLDVGNHIGAQSGRIRNSGVELADGGDVRGAGSSIGDKIPAWLSDGEFVMNARTTAVNRPFLQALNADPQFLQKMLASQADRGRRGSGNAYAPPPPPGQPATVNISMSSGEDIISRLKVLAIQWELSRS